ncbi:MAG: bifunctional demethylmenaquinone methyltransferase/2-methoxy-6-polyprenyl-1,4-benzoquinol methylase UbiE [Desulfobacterium sp.]|jgi:demethylmenaquinone methyltransferase/2-methoxy-6-polyprenyl-1,4-benzoquinol methylase|nr:bifunctional demethylmenaquinone methyltransferase/2-methoxy-6-polyprenyl-1,4-benzoquinol methylase UbiE [Desulfobacterium sp.]
MNMELDFIREMFDSIAPKYDFLNHFLSLGQDVRWRQEMVLAAEIPSKGAVLDVACGTCDVTMAIKRETGTEATIIGTDFSPGMLALGQQKIKQDKNFQSIDLVCGNALTLPFKNNRFNAVLIAFGIRNIMDRQGALEQFYKVLKPGGSMIVLELTAPENKLFRQIYLFYFRRILPAVGTLFSKNSNAYHYLPASVLNFPSRRKFSKIMTGAGFTGVKWKTMTFGIVTLFAAKKESRKP